MPQKRKATEDLPRPSKQTVKENSTVRRKNLGEFIQSFGDKMPRACSNCRRLGVECKVHVRSGICGKCHLAGSGQTCDVRVTQEEWARLISERARLLQEMKVAMETQKAAQAAQAAAEVARSQAEEARRVAAQSQYAAFDEEVRLREELRKIEVEAEEAIMVEEAQIRMLERKEAEQEAERNSSLALSPYTWSAMDGIPDDFWDGSEAVPWVTTCN